MSSVPESLEQSTQAATLEGGQLAQQISELGEWFHNLNLHGVPTAPHHFLGDFPAMYFIEKSYSHDPTNWWIPNRACVEAMLRSSGFRIVDHPEGEVYICRKETVHAG